MVSISSLTLTPPITNASFSAPVVATADRVSLRQTPIAVPAPLHDERVNDNNPQTPARQALTQSAAEPQDTVNTNDSAAYVTQQASEDPETTLGAFSAFAPALQYNKLVSYSLVKYKPSDAGLPSGRNTAVAATTPDHQDSATVATEYRTYNDTQLRNLSELSQTAPSLLIAG